MKLKSHYLLFFLFWAAVNSCISIQKELDPKVYYTRDLKIKYDGNVYNGVGVLPNKENYKFRIISEGRMDLLVIETCHREITVEKVGFREGYFFEPIKNEETRSDCSYIRFASFEHKKGRHGDGFLVREHSDYNLKARVKCNGKSKEYNGTSVCQAKTGLFQSIEFDTKVKIYMSKCILKVEKEASYFRFKMPNRACRFTFQDEKGNRHILYTEGYEQILIRE